MSIKNKLTNIINDDTPGEVIAEYINRILREGKNFGRSNYGNNKKQPFLHVPMHVLEPTKFKTNNSPYS